MLNSDLVQVVTFVVKHLSKPTLKFIIEGTGQVYNEAMQEKLVDKYTQGNPLQLYRPGFPERIELPKFDKKLQKKINRLNKTSKPVPASKYEPLSADIAYRSRNPKKVEVPNDFEFSKRIKELGRHGYYV